MAMAAFLNYFVLPSSVAIKLSRVKIHLLANVIVLTDKNVIFSEIYSSYQTLHSEKHTMFLYHSESSEAINQNKSLFYFN